MWKSSTSVAFSILFLTILQQAISLPFASENIFFPDSDNVLKTRARLGISGPKPGKKDVMKCLDLGDFMPAFNFTSEQFECYALTGRRPCEGNRRLIKTTFKNKKI
jgi:hypothetical protein